MNYSLYKQAAELIKLAGPVLFNDSEQYDNLADGIETVPENDGQMSGTSTASDQTQSMYFRGDPENLQNTVHGDFTPEVTSYVVPRDPNGGSYLTGIGGNTMNYMMLRDAASQLRPKVQGFWPEPNTGTLSTTSDFLTKPVRSVGGTLMHTGFGGLELVSAVKNALNARKAYTDGTWNQWEVPAYALQSALSGNNAVAFGGEAIAPLIARKGLGNIVLRGISRAGKLTPITFGGGLLLEAGHQEAERLHKGTERANKWDAETTNLPAKWIAWMQQHPDEAYGLNSIAGQNPELFQNIVRAAQETTKTWAQNKADASKAQTSNPSDAYYAKPMSVSDYIWPYSWYDHYLRNRENTYNYRENQITGSLDRTLPENNWMNEEVVYVDSDGIEKTTTAGAIYMQALQDIRKREDPTFVTTDSGVVRSHRAGGMKEPGEPDDDFLTSMGKSLYEAEQTRKQEEKEVRKSIPWYLRPFYNPSALDSM